MAVSDKCVGISMDSLIATAARALAAGDSLRALNYIAWRDDAAALALRGMAMAQLGQLVCAKALLRRAARAFGPTQPLARARCAVAEAEIGLVSRDVKGLVKALDTAYDVLTRYADHTNATQARYLKVRYLLLIGRLGQAEQSFAGLDPLALPFASQAGYELVVAGIAMRRLKIETAYAALARAKSIARQACIPSVLAEVEAAIRALDSPAARLIALGAERHLRLADIESLMASKALIVDACRHVVCDSGNVISLIRRPVLFVLARTLAEAWPEGVSRATLLSRAFRVKHIDESHRARLRVEMGRLRQAMRPIAGIQATKAGFTLLPWKAQEVVVLAPPTEEAHASVLALLADGEAWSSSALALALSVSQRTVQRALDELIGCGKVQTVGHGRARRCMVSPVLGYPTALLLPVSLPGG